MKRNLINVGICLVLITNASVMLGNPPPQKDDNRITFDEEELESTMSELPMVENRKFVSDGNGVVLDRLGVTFFPPKAWEVKTSNGNGPTVVMKEPKREVNSKNPLDYQRNIILSMMHSPSPIDKQRAKEFRTQLMESYGKRLDSYQITEMRFFDYRDKKDGLLVYSASKSKKIEMTHMHLLVSGEKRQVMMTYTDLSKRFTDTPAMMEEAWNAMASVDIKGKPAKRFAMAKQYGIVGGIVFLLLLILVIVRKVWASRQLRKFVEIEEAEVADEGATMVMPNGSQGHAGHLEKTQAASMTPQLDIGLAESWYSNPGIKEPEHNPLQSGSLVSGVWNLNGSGDDDWVSKA